jgi:hypothetical protein
VDSPRSHLGEKKDFAQVLGSRRTVIQEDHWIMKDYDSRSWIGGEGLPSRDQIKEKREQR